MSLKNAQVALVALGKKAGPNEAQHARTLVAAMGEISVRLDASEAILKALAVKAGVTAQDLAKIHPTAAWLPTAKQILK